MEVISKWKMVIYWDKLQNKDQAVLEAWST